MILMVFQYKPFRHFFADFYHDRSYDYKDGFFKRDVVSCYHICRNIYRVLGIK